MLLFSNGGAKSKKRQSLKRKRTVAGRLSDPVDVRSPSDINAFERLLEKGPLTIVLIYADWCGACHRFKGSTWKEINHMPSRTMNIGAVREDMLNQTSLKNAKIEHYPSLLLVGTDKKPGEFVSAKGEVTNALPNDDAASLKELLKTPVPEEMAPEKAVVNVSQQNNLPVAPSATVNRPLEANVTGPLATSMLPPSPSDDLKVSAQNANAVASMPPRKAPVGGGARRGLLEALAQVAEKAGPAAIFITAASTLRRKRRSTKRRRRGRGRTMKKRGAK